MAVANVESPPDAVDKVYAESLFELVESRGGRERLEEIASELEEILEVLRENPRAREFMASMIIPAKQKEASLRRIFEGRVSPELLNLILLLNKKGRGTRFRRMATAFDQLMQERFGKVEVDVFARYPLSSEELERLRSMVQGALNREPVIYTYTDPKMVGGIKIRVGDRLIDASIDTRLREMRDKLKTEGASEVKRRFTDIFEDEQG